MTKYLLSIISIFFITTVLSSCDSSVVYENEKTFEEGKWRFSDAFSSNFNINDNSVPLDIDIRIVHTDNYPYENIYLRLTHDLGTNKKIDTLTFNLSDKYGHWKGDKNWTGNYEYIFNYLKNYKTDKKSGNITIEQFSRDNILSGVNKIGIHIKKKRK